MDLNLSMFGRNANKPLPLHLQKIELHEINVSINKGSNDNFNRFGTVQKVALIEQNNEFGTFKEYVFCEVYEIVKNHKNIKFLTFLTVLTTDYDRLKYFIYEANNFGKKKNDDNIGICQDRMRILKQH